MFGELSFGHITKAEINFNNIENINPVEPCTICYEIHHLIDAKIIKKGQYEESSEKLCGKCLLEITGFNTMGIR